MHSVHCAELLRQCVRHSMNLFLGHTHNSTQAGPRPQANMPLQIFAEYSEPGGTHGEPHRVCVQKLRRPINRMYLRHDCFRRALSSAEHVSVAHGRMIRSNGTSDEVMLRDE